MTDNSQTQVVVISLAELRQEIRAGVTEVLEQRSEQLARPAYLNRTQMAKYLGISGTQLDRLRSRGLPEHKAGGSSPRFNPDECMRWLSEHFKGGDWHASDDDATSAPSSQ